MPFLDQHQSPFFRLPPELRNHIYALSHETYLNFWGGYTCVTDFASRPAVRAVPGLMRTCKRVYREAQPLLYQYCAAWLHVVPNSIGLTCMGRFDGALVRDLHIIWNGYYGHPAHRPRYWDPNAKNDEFFAYLRRTAHQLRVIQFHQWDGRRGPLQTAERYLREQGDLLAAWLAGIESLRVVKFSGLEGGLWKEIMDEKLMPRNIKVINLQ